ncbi:hypothetical protein GY993_24300, partial [Escherichia coli]|nr:hypothetical protein [Escherichia coli]
MPVWGTIPTPPTISAARWSPDPRLVLYPDRLHVGRSLRKTLNRTTLRITFDA